MFSAAAFSTSAFSPDAWLFDTLPAAQPQTPASQGGAGAQTRKARAARIARNNDNLLALVSMIVTSGILEGPEP